MVLAIVQRFANIKYELVTLPQLAPTLGYLLTILLFKTVFIPVKIDFNRAILSKSFFSLFIPLALFSMTYFIGKSLNVNIQINNKLPQIIFLMLFGIVLGGIGEEIGWRSFFQPLLEYKYSKIISSIIVGVVWGLWHIGHYQNGLLFMVCFLLFTISSSIIIVCLLKDTQNSILLSSLFHISINICFIVFFENSLTNIKLFIINGIVWVLPAIVVILLNKKYYLLK
jgi:membrane protease YdiL (CAAX protease family)